MITIYGKDACSQCDQAKKLCESNGVEYEYFKVGVDLTVDELIAKCPEPIRSVPQIFNDGAYIGGFACLPIHLSLVSLS